jgi:outer membrane protein assembly factor BamD (BamD/ComL family)
LAAQAAPSWSDPYYKLGHANLNKADYEKAQETFKKFLTLESSSPRAAKVKKTVEDLEKIRK